MSYHVTYPSSCVRSDTEERIFDLFFSLTCYDHDDN